MTAPTEAEIREAVAMALDRSSEIDLGSWVHELASPIRWLQPDDRGPGEPGFDPVLWVDLRPSQGKRLDALIEAIYDEADIIEKEAIARITELVVKAGLQFAAEYPDAPRAKEAVPA